MEYERIGCEIMVMTLGFRSRNTTSSPDSEERIVRTKENDPKACLQRGPEAQEPEKRPARRIYSNSVLFLKSGH